MTTNTTIIRMGANCPPGPPGAAWAKASGIKPFIRAPVGNPAGPPAGAKGRHYATAPVGACLGVGRGEKSPDWAVERDAGAETVGLRHNPARASHPPRQHRNCERLLVDRFLPAGEVGRRPRRKPSLGD